MNKEEFLQRLRNLLSGIPATEAEEALAYYRDYFADAGVENEARVIEELGSPEKVAENIRKDLGYPAEHNPEATYRDPYPNPYPNPYPEQNTGSGSYENRTYGEYAAGYGTAANTRTSSQESENKKSGATGWIILAICTCWLWGPLLIGAAATLFGLIVAAIGTVIGLAAASFGLIVAGIVLIGVGIAKMVISPAGGMVLLGVGMLLVGISLFGTVLVALIVGKAVPALFKWIASLFRKVFGKGGNVA